MIQPRFAVEGVSICAACARQCVPAGLAEPVARAPLAPFECGVAALAAAGVGADVFGDAVATTAPSAAACEASLARAVAAQAAGAAPASCATTCLLYTSPSPRDS